MYSCFLTFHACMPQSRTPNCWDVVDWHLRRCDFFFFSFASIPYCRVPIFKSSTQGLFIPAVRSSRRRKNCTRSSFLNCASLGLLGNIVVMLVIRWGSDGSDTLAAAADSSARRPLAGFLSGSGEARRFATGEGFEGMEAS